jgi:hypothetical protein
MTTRIDWRRELDESFGRAPDRPVADYVAAGERAVRRRRAAACISGLAVVAVLGGVGWAALPDEPWAEVPIATDSGQGRDDAALAPMATSPEDVLQPDRELGVFEAPDAMAVTVLHDGELVHKPGWVVEELRALADRDSRRIWAISVAPSGGGPGQWILLTWEPGQLAAALDVPGERFDSFDDWVDDARAEQQDSAPPAPVRLKGGRVVPGAGVEVLEQVDAPEEAAAWGPVEDQVVVKLRRPDGTILFALVDPRGATWVRSAALPHPTMAAFLGHLAEHGPDGEGSR